MKKIIKKEIFSRMLDGDCAEVRYSDLPKDIQENDIIEIVRDEGFRSENNSYDAYTELIVIREVEETDEEYMERLKTLRYENYLTLKAEFEQLDNQKK